jgi:sugar/nucleoside kinase (ribokinase family)
LICTMKYDITTIGDAFEDVFVSPDMNVHSDRALGSGRGITFEFGEKIPLKSVNYEIGGSACNAAVGFSRLGYNASIVTLLGDDTPMNRILDRLTEEGVDRYNIIVDGKSQTGFSVIFNINGERTIFVYHAVKDYQNLRIRRGLKSKWYFIAPLGDKTETIEKRMIEDVAENGSLIAWNPGSLQIEKGASHFRHLLNCTSILFLNKEEAVKFVDFPVRPQIEEVIKKLYSYGPKIVVITNGKEGAKAYDGKEFYDISSRPIQVTDSTGAGDAFAIGFLGRLMKEDWKAEIPQEAVKEALKWGIENSVSVIQHIGAQKGLLKNIT